MSDSYNIEDYVGGDGVTCSNINKSAEDMEKYMTELTDAVDKLYLFRDHYFENHSTEKAKDRENEVKERLEKTLTKFDSQQETSIDDSSVRADYFYLKGKALNIMPKYDQDAVQALSKAVKLKPNLVDAWNELGECYWKNNNLLEAKSCFSGALPHKRNKISLRNMSVVLRQESYSTFQERQKNIERSVELAKESVQLDPKDGLSWVTLGNAYLCSFFTIAQDPNILKLCMSSYKQALSDPIARGQPDFYYNRATAFVYEEEYSNAIESFSKACELDPTWEDPMNEKQRLLTYLDDLNEFVRTNGKVKGKRLQQMLQQLNNKQLGPYADGKYTSGNHSVNLKYISMSKVMAEVNQEVVVLGKVVCSVRNERSIPFTFCIVDTDGTCVAVTVYNLADGKGVIIGDSVAIPEPFLTQHQFSCNNKDYKFSSIRVDNPMVMVVNGKKLSKDQIAGAKVTSTARMP